MSACVTDGRRHIQATSVEAGKVLGRAPMNTFMQIPAFPQAEFRDVVRANFDTLYSIAWLDLTKEPIIILVPDTDGLLDTANRRKSSYPEG